MWGGENEADGLSVAEKILEYLEKPRDLMAACGRSARTRYAVFSGCIKNYGAGVEAKVQF